MWRGDKMAPQRMYACVPSVAVPPPTEHNLLELHTQPQGLFSYSTDALPGGFSDFQHAVSRVTTGLRFQTLLELHILVLFSPPFGNRHLQTQFCHKQTPHYRYQRGSNKPITQCLGVPLGLISHTVCAHWGTIKHSQSNVPWGNWVLNISFLLVLKKPYEQGLVLIQGIWVL